MSKSIVGLVLATALASSAQAAIVITAPGQAYAQNFDTLAASGTAAVTWANDSTLAGWSLFSTALNPIASYTPGTGSSNAGAFYSFGASGIAERALGGVGSNALTGYIAAQFVNSTGQALTGFTLGFDGEQWRNGGNASLAAQTMVMQYGFGSSFATVATWSNPGGSFDWSSPVNTATAGAVVGNTAGLVAGRGGTVAATWAPGATLWLRWIEQNDTGNDHALAIDNVSFTAGPAVAAAVPLPPAGWLVASGLACLGWRLRQGQTRARA